MPSHKHIYYIFILCLGGIFFINCSYNAGEEPVPQNKNVSYALDVKPILVTHCYACHTDTSTNADRPGYAFFNYFDQLKKETKPSASNSNYSILVARLKHIELPGMPYNQAPLSDSLIRVIEDWILIGAPEN